MDTQKQVQLLTKEELAVHCRVSVPTIDRWRRGGVIVPIKFGNRCLFDSQAITAAAAAKQRNRSVEPATA